MKNLFKVAAFFVGTTMIFSSCECKQRTEPLPNPNPEPTPAPTPEPPKPVDPNSAILLQLDESSTDIIFAVKGENVSITEDGFETKEINTEEKQHTIKANKESSIFYLKGSITNFTLLKGKFAKVDLSNAPASIKELHFLRFTSKPTDNSLKIKDLIMGKLDYLEGLTFGNIGLGSKEYDLSKYPNLKYLYLVNSGGIYNLPNTISTLFLNEEGNKTIKNDLNLKTFPKMKKLYLFGTYLAKDIDFSNSEYLVTFSNHRSNTPNINLSNSKKLTDVLISDLNNNGGKINLSNNPLLKEGVPNKSLINFKGFVTYEFAQALDLLNLSGASLTKVDKNSIDIPMLKELDLSNNKLVTASFAHIKSLKMLNLMGNTTLQGDNLKAALNSLPATNGTLRMSGLDAEMKKIVTDKGWTLQEQ